MATERLYYTDPYLTEFEAQIVDQSADGRKVYLDRTAFYPSSGGQPNDLGRLGGIEVLDVVDEGDRVMHSLHSAIPAGCVKGQVDWNRRYEHMQQHTGQHRLSAVLMALFNFKTVSFHMGSDVSTIELEVKEITEDQVARAEDRVNNAAREAARVIISFENAGAAVGLRKPSARSGPLRVIEIEGQDRSACGGTHVRSTAELLPVQIRRLEKIRGNVRIEFVCGQRATERSRRDFRLLAQLGKMNTSSIDLLPEQIEAMRKRLAYSEKEAQKLATEVARREGEALYQATPVPVDGIRRLRLQVDTITDRQQIMAKAYLEQGRAVVLLAGGSPLRVLISCSEDSGYHAGTVLRQVLSLSGGRGGGSGASAQAVLTGPDAVEMLASALGFEEPSPRS